MIKNFETTANVVTYQSSEIEFKIGDTATADIVAHYFAKVDARCKLELEKRTIVSSRDYITSLTTGVRDEISEQLGLQSYVQERQSGDINDDEVSGMMVFYSGDLVKFGLYEVRNPQHISNFSRQIEKQDIWRAELGLWEMFLNNDSIDFENATLNQYGSSCIRHLNAYNFMLAENLTNQKWTTDDLKCLLMKSGTAFYSIVHAVGKCREFRLHKINPAIQKYSITSIKDSYKTMDIPIFNDTENSHEQIEEFLVKNELDNYMFINLNRD